MMSYNELVALEAFLIFCVVIRVYWAVHGLTLLTAVYCGVLYGPYVMILVDYRDMLRL